MVQQGTPEQYFGLPVTESRVIIGEPIPTFPTKVVEPVEVKYAQLQTTPDYMPLVIGVCFLGTVCFLGFLAFLAWTWEK